MDVSDLFRQEGDDAVVLHVHVQPAAGRSAAVGRHGAALKVRVAAAPEGGRANEATAALLAETFGLKAAQIELVNGASSRAKQFRLAGVEVAEFVRRLEQTVGGSGPPTGRQASPGRR